MYLAAKIPLNVSYAAERGYVNKLPTIPPMA
jgi:hypothetical protein